MQQVVAWMARSLKVGIWIDVDTREKERYHLVSVHIWGLSKEPYLYIFEAFPLRWIKDQGPWRIIDIKTNIKGGKCVKYWLQKSRWLFVVSTKYSSSNLIEFRRLQCHRSRLMLSLTCWRGSGGLSKKVVVRRGAKLISRRRDGNEI